MKGVDDGVHGREDEAVAFARGPVDEIALPDRGLVARDQAVGPRPPEEKSGLQRVIACRHPRPVAAVHPVRVRHEDHVRPPLRRPGRVLHEPVERVARHLAIAVRGVVAQLIEVRVSLVRDPFAVAVHVHARERRGLDGIAAQLPDAIEQAVRGAERGRVIVPRCGEHRSAPDLSWREFAGPPLDLHPPERQHHRPKPPA